VGWHLVSRDTSQSSSSLVVAATVESLAENITDGLTSPLLFFALGGLPGAWAYRFCNTCDSMLGYRDPEREYLGKFTARLDDVLNWLPARLTGALIVFAAALSGEDARNAWCTMPTEHRRTASPNAGWTMSAMAGALGVTLEKVGHYRLEGGNGPLDADTIERCFRVMRWTMALVVCYVILLMGVLHVCFA
jgi:adenosylcobinamide-phosphate synthase